MTVEKFKQMTKKYPTNDNMMVEVVLKKKMAYKESLDLIKKMKGGWTVNIYEENFHNDGTRKPINKCSECGEEKNKAELYYGLCEDCQNDNAGL